MKKINVGCGGEILGGFENYDINPIKDKVKFIDLNKKLPFEDSSIDFILASHVLEHLDNPIKTLKEFHRVCKARAKIDIYVPHFSHFTNYADLTHNKSFSYFTLGEDFTNKVLIGMFKVEKKLNFNRINYAWMNVFMNPLINFSPILYERFFCMCKPFCPPC